MKHVRAKKQLGQHFLKDDDVALRITEALTHHRGYRSVIEIGPGTGALTKHLLKRTDIDLSCVELDREAAAHLLEYFPDLKDRLIIGDVLQLDLSERFTEGFAVIGNFPYNISTEIIFQALEHRDQCMEVVGMFQKEVADRVRANPGSKVYGITSVLAQAFYDIDEIMTVGPEQFIPPPKVQSAVIRMRRNNVNVLACNEKLFTRVVKTAFNQRRKTLRNALKTMPELVGNIPEKFRMLRAERLSVQNFIELTLAAESADRSFSGSVDE